MSFTHVRYVPGRYNGNSTLTEYYFQLVRQCYFQLVRQYYFQLVRHYFFQLVRQYYFQSVRGIYPPSVQTEQGFLIEILKGESGNKIIGGKYVSKC